ncbi:OLC1v1022082C1 [Oldenlandia corymbosa var. corymbosa]|uniref:OLC1v1022082C1 n=1 Tax=Oldenlandia corymbosa var. corymbosa TaxID=529605 RepID=A0AAV1BXN9_OLDCO|nr:OLC1v1022082C1 [Oldenlandia corymbosa var. corymbosa]
MSAMETLVRSKLKIKVKCARIGSERISCQNGSKADVPVSNGEVPALSGCNKRKHDLTNEDRMDKRRKMDPMVKRQCNSIVDVLLGHRHGFAFKCPVDPVLLNIPDYFSIISHPMDLGTVKSKLAGNSYFTAEEFAADVKLTFSNAMLYNPPDNCVHHMAKELECIFLKRWKLLEAKWNREMENAQKGTISGAVVPVKSCSSNSGPSGPSGLHQRSTVQSSTLSSSVKITKVGEDSGKILNKKPHLNSSSVETPRKASMSTEEKAKLKKDLMEILVGRTSQKLQSWFKKLGIQSWKKEVIALEFDKFRDDMLWQLKSVLQDAKENVSKISATTVIGSDQSSLGLAGDINEASSLSRTDHLVPVPVTTSSEGQPPAVTDEVDLKKALRAAMLKMRYAETISKANSGKADSGNVQQEIERLQREEANVKALMRSEELKKEEQRKKERKAARDGLDMMEKTAEYEDSLLVFRELEKLCGCYVSYESGLRVVLKDCYTRKVIKPLELLGLCLKDDFVADDDEASMNCEMEEGEILE